MKRKLTRAHLRQILLEEAAALREAAGLTVYDIFAQSNNSGRLPSKSRPANDWKLDGKDIFSEMSFTDAYKQVKELLQLFDIAAEYYEKNDERT